VIRMVLSLAMAAAFVSTPAWALFETNKQLAESAKIPMEQAIRTATGEVPGKAVEAQLGKEDGKTVYEIDIIDSSKKERTVYIDAQTGQVIKVEK